MQIFAVSKKSGVRIKFKSKYLLHKSNKNTIKNRIKTFFRILEINQRFAAIWGMRSKEKQLTLSKNAKVCGNLTYTIPRPPSPDLQYPWKPIVHSHSKKQPGKGRTVLEILHSPIPRDFSLYDLSFGFLEYHIYKSDFIWLDSAYTIQKAFCPKAFIENHM